jgi:hypothetical protein
VRTAVGAASEADEVCAAMEAVDAVFVAPEEVKRELGKFLPWPVSSDVAGGGPA